MSEDLQFDRAEMSTGAACQSCQTPLRGHYFQANGAMLCDTCVASLQNALTGQGSRAGRFLKALLLGAGAALLGGLGYGLFIIFTSIEFALVTIAIGWFVGSAVRRGSGGRGGWRYGLLAVFLTYSALSLSYVAVGIAEFRKGPKTAEVVKEGKSLATTTERSAEPAAGAPADEIDAVSEHPPMSPGVAILALLGMALASPVMVAFSSPLSGLISGFGIWKAWTMNRSANIQITGPHALGEAAPAPGA
jgi:hypothetical protein